MPRPRRVRVGTSSRIGLGVIAALIVIVLFSLRGIAGFWTDLLWFESLDHRGVFTGVLGAKATLVVVFTLVFFALMWLNLWVADRIAPRFRPTGPEEDVIERYYELVGNRTGLVRIGVSAAFALLAGVGVSGQWQNWLLFRNGSDFGIKDEQFHMDVGFYIFRLPFLSFVTDWLFVSILIVLIVTIGAHYLNGGIRLQGPGTRVSAQVKAHISLLLA